MSDTPTSGLEWRAPREQGYLKVLPSGKQAYLRPVTPAGLMSVLGEIPDTLTPLVSRMVYEGITYDHIKEVIAMVTPDDTKESLKRAQDGVSFANTVCKLSFVAPRIVDAPRQDDEISLDDIELGDRLFVLSLATQPAGVLRSFRFQSLANVEDVPERNDAQPEAESVGGD
jgi:hypothetical protein